MAGFTLAAFAAIAAAMFVTELTDKDAFLLIAVSSRARAKVALLAGVTAFTLTSALFVTVGSVLLVVVPVFYVRVAGGVIMLSYGLWEFRGLVGLKETQEQERRLALSGGRARAFLALVGALALLDVAGDATEVLTIVFVAHYSDPLLVFAGACAGLYLATALETAMGSALGKFLTPNRLRYGSAAVFLVLGSAILLLSL